MKNLVFILILFFSNIGSAREYIRIVGSSTLYHFVTIAAEKFGKTYGKTPIVEATGTGAGFHLFCSGNNLKFPDIVNASRIIRESELKFCQKNKVDNIDSFILGYDGIVFAQNKNARKLEPSKKDLYLALAKKIFVDGKLIINSFKTWREINPNLPNINIEIYGPSFNSGTRDSLIELIMNEFCSESACKEIREDGRYIEMPENDNLIVHKLLLNKKAIGIISFNMLGENNKIKALSVNSIKANHENIISNLYPLARPLYIYYNKDHAKEIPLIDAFISSLKSENAIGKNGYLTLKGLLNKYE